MTRVLEKLTNSESTLPGQEHWVNKDGARLFLWEKQRAPNSDYLGTILFIHGSSWASLPSFDLQIPGRRSSSVMDWFAMRGFDCWCGDAEGYGRSDKNRDSQFGIDSGVEDIAAASDYILPLRRLDNLMMYGTSSGALKAALFTQRFPARVKRLALDAFVWTGKDSRTLEQRRKLVPELLESKRRPFTYEFIRSVFERDHPGTADDEVVEALAREAMKWDQTVPIGTYVDTCTRLPIVDPEKISVPTIVMRGQYDGLASNADLYEFFAKLPHPDKQFAHMPGVAHAGFHQKNYQLIYQILWSFFTQPKPVYQG